MRRRKNSEITPAEIKNLILSHWPDSTVSVRRPRLGRATYVRFALWDKDFWPNGIARNDPAFHSFWINQKYDGTYELALSEGGSLWGWNAKRLGKIGWRNAKGDIPKIMKTLDTYFGKKLPKAAEKHAAELHDSKTRGKIGFLKRHKDPSMREQGYQMEEILYPKPNPRRRRR